MWCDNFLFYFTDYHTAIALCWNSVGNPKCEDAPGCGEWKRPTIKNPKYKGKWVRPMIDNPNYKVRYSALWDVETQLVEVMCRELFVCLLV